MKKKKLNEIVDRCSFKASLITIYHFFIANSSRAFVSTQCDVFSNSWNIGLLKYEPLKVFVVLFDHRPS